MNSSIKNPDSFVSRNPVYYKIIIFLTLMFFMLLMACSPAKKPVDNGEKPKCGECLDMPTGEVCTTSGTKRNSCLAICENVKILCFEKCPCPDES